MFSFNVDDQIKIEMLQQQHKEELFDLIDNNRDHLRKWLLWVDKRKSAQDFESIIPIWITNYANNNGFDAGIRYNGTLVGMIGLHFIDWKNRETSIGYFLAEQYQGKGIVTRCVRALVNYLFEEMEIGVKHSFFLDDSNHFILIFCLALIFLFVIAQTNFRGTGFSKNPVNYKH